MKRWEINAGLNRIARATSARSSGYTRELKAVFIHLLILI